MRAYPTADCLPVPSAELGEGPLWHADTERLFWIDIAGSELRTYSSRSGEYESWPTVKTPGFAVLCADDADGCGLVLGLKGCLARFRVDAQGFREMDLLCELEADLPENRCNDGKCDPAGRLWFGTMHEAAAEASGSLYCYDGKQAPRRILDGLTIANGMAWSADQSTFFFTDSATREVHAYDFDPARGRIANGRAVIRVPDDFGLPDGMAIDAQDKLWIAHWGDGRVRCWDPKSGQLLTEISVPTANTTSCAFGGQNNAELFITSAADESVKPSKSAGENSGGLFHWKTAVTGGAVYQFSTVR